MTDYFFDSSALVKRYVLETGTKMPQPSSMIFALIQPINTFSWTSQML